MSIINCVIASTVTKGYAARLNGAGANGLPLALLASDGTTAGAHSNVGVFLSDGVSGDVVAVLLNEQCDFCIAGASITIGGRVAPTAAGKFVNGASGDRTVGRCVRGKSSAGATADGAQCSIVFDGPLDIA